MPFLMIKTNLDLEKTTIQALLNHSSRVVAEALKKPESYVMVDICANEHMVFAGTSMPTVYMEMKSVGLTKEQIPMLSDALTKMVEQRLKVPGNRVYIEFASVPGILWGYNGSTF